MRPPGWFSSPSPSSGCWPRTAGCPSPAWDDALPWLEPATPLPVEPAELLLLLTLARRIAAVRARLLAAPDDGGTLIELGRALPDTSELIRKVAPKLGRDGTVPDDASPELGRLRRATTRLRMELLARLEEVRRSHADVVTDAPPTVRRDRYCVPVRAGARSRLQGLLLDSSGSGATAFMEPFAVVELNNELAETMARERDEIRRILAEIAALFGAVRGELASAVEVMATLDAAQARVLFGELVRGRLAVPSPNREMCSSARATRCSTSASTRCALRSSAPPNGAIPPTAWCRSTSGSPPEAAPWSCPAPTPEARR